ncbi:MAG: proline--tRNA ligase [Minisyncoccales bacterium]
MDSYKNLPFALFQIQDKFRNEMRATGGLLRTREFSMKDLYSFHKDEKSVENFYKKVKEAYFTIYKRCGIDAVCVDAESGSIGGDFSDEFMIPADSGEDRILLCQECGYGANIEKTGEIKKCPKCKGKIKEEKAIEVGHVFKLGTKYSEAMGATFMDENGEEHPIVMGCYGIGVSRLMATIVEVRHDKNGIIWPLEIAPFSVHLIELGNSVKVKKEAEKLYNTLKGENISVLYDERDKSAGEKFADSDLMGIPFRLVVSEKSLKKNSVGFKKRDEEEENFVKTKKIENILKNKLDYEF